MSKEETTTTDVETKSFDIWVEGYSATGQSSGATLMGTVTAVSFDEAVKAHVAKLNKSSADYYRRSDDGKWTMWGCRLFDNERDARKSYG